MPSSDAKVNANRQNAKHSTGPRTDAGKQRSSLNATRHGLTSQVVVLPSEDMQAYNALHQQTMKFWAPGNIHEERLVQRLIETDWRLHRCPSLENSLFALGHSEAAADIDSGHPEIHAALTAARVLREYSGPLESLGRHEARLVRIYQSTLTQLQEAQSQRKEQESIDFYNAENLYMTSKMKEIPYNPAHDGFVLTNAQIETEMARRDRRKEAKVAEKTAYDYEEFLALTQSA